MQELMAARQGGGNQHNPEQQNAQEDAKREAEERRQMMLSQILFPEARERRESETQHANAIFYTTGYLGSLTTFSGWNQEMLELSVSGHRLFAALGFLIGLLLVSISIQFGIETAKGFRWLLNRLNIMSSENGSGSRINCKLDSYRSQLIVMVIFLVTLGILWGVMGALVKAKFKHGGSAAELWLGCMVGPIGMWIRWFLAWFNGRGIERVGLFKWIPFGTLIANVSAACLTAALAIVKNALNTKNCYIVVGGLQFGLMGCLGTVSTFATEFNAMRENVPFRKCPYRLQRQFCFALIELKIQLFHKLYFVDG